MHRMLLQMGCKGERVDVLLLQYRGAEESRQQGARVRCHCSRSWWVQRGGRVLHSNGPIGRLSHSSANWRQLDQTHDALAPVRRVSRA